MEIGSGVSNGKKHLTVLQKRFIRLGFESLEQKERIELLLSLILPSRKYENLVEVCIHKFKNFRKFLAASPRELAQAGIALPCISTIKLLRELPAAILKEKIVEESVHNCSREIFDYLRYSMQSLEKEVFRVIYINNRNQIIDTVDLFEGTLDRIPICPREIMEGAINHNATHLIFAHNHPSYDPTPSKSDKQLTRDLVFIGMILDTRVLDHIIIGGDTYFSFADQGLISEYEDDFLNLRIKVIFDDRVDCFKK